MSTTTHLKKLLANTYALYLKTQNYHWNVTGAHFYSLHKMLEEQYGELAEAVDEIAERIRMLGEHAPGSFAEFAKLLVIDEAAGKLSAADMLQQLVADHAAIVKLCYDTLAKAQESSDEGTAGLVAERIGAHEKVMWMLKSSH